MFKTVKKVWKHAQLKARLLFLSNPTNAMTKAVRRSLVEPGFPSGLNDCQMWARKTYEIPFGKKFEWARRGTAVGTAGAFKGTQYDVTGEKPQPGDLKYQWGPGHSAAGHVGIQIEDGRTAQNGYKTFDGHDARGILKDAEFGPHQLLVRLHQ